MGLKLFGSSSLTRSSTGSYLPNDPRPENFKVLDLKQIGDYVVGVVHYPNATNFEGDKILVWQYATIAEIKRYATIDPHFLEGNKIFARFRPTGEGLQAAIALCEALNGN